MPRTKTTYEDLSNLGWPKNDVYNAANAARGGSMRGLVDMSLNSGVAETWQWWSYNATRGKPYITATTPTSASVQQTAWSYDNSANSEPFEDQWTEAWENKVSAELSVSTALTIGMEESITIPDVASSGFTMSLAVNASTTVQKERTHSLSHTWTLSVGPHEKVTLIRVVTTSTVITDYAQEFGLAEGSKIGTDGNKWNDHFFWGFDLNEILYSPKGTMKLQGVGTSITYDFKLVREGATGQQLVPLEHDGKRAAVEMGLGVNAAAKPVDIGVPGVALDSEQDSQALRVAAV